MTNWIFYPRLPPSLLVIKQERPRRAELTLELIRMSVIGEVNIVSISQLNCTCWTLNDAYCFPTMLYGHQMKATHIGYDGDWKELRHDDHSLIPSQWIEDKCETFPSNGFPQKWLSCIECTITWNFTSSTSTTDTRCLLQQSYSSFSKQF